MLRKIRGSRRLAPGGYPAAGAGPGFTLIELLMVMVVLAVIMVIALPKISNQKTRANEAALRTDLMLLRKAIANFQVDTGNYPAALADLKATTSAATYGTGGNVSALAGSAGFSCPYIDPALGIPTDPVTPGTAFTYTVATGTVNSSNTGFALDGATHYNTW